MDPSAQNNSSDVALDCFRTSPDGAIEYAAQQPGDLRLFCEALCSSPHVTAAITSLRLSAENDCAATSGSLEFAEDLRKEYGIEASGDNVSICSIIPSAQLTRSRSQTMVPTPKTRTPLSFCLPSTKRTRTTWTLPRATRRTSCLARRLLATPSPLCRLQQRPQIARRHHHRRPKNASSLTRGTRRSKTSGP